MGFGRWLKHAYAISLVLLLHINSSLSLGHNHYANVTARCVERERDALLAIKGDLVDEYNLLSSWGGEDCCGWDRVHCDHQTGHVIRLYLNGLRELNSSQGQYYIWKYFQGEISPKIIELQYLEYLDLSYNSFNASQIPALICSLSNLRHLDLYWNYLNGTKILELIGNLTNLRYLDLSSISFSGELPIFQFPSNLRHLDLSDNYLNGTKIPKLIGNLTNLRYLDLSWNSFSGELPIFQFPSNLRHLDLSYNDLNGTKIPELIGNLTNLRYLDLSWNAFVDEFPYFQLRNLTHLQYLNLGYQFGFNTRAVGNLDLSWLPHLSSIKYLDLSGTNLSKASDWLETINKLPNLRDLTLQYCDLPSPIHSALSNINSSNSLVSVTLARNSIVSPSIFKWLCNYNTTLVHLDLSFTQMSGLIPNLFRNMRSLEYLDLSWNQLSGFIPDAFTNMSSLAVLDLSSNQLSGLIPDAFANMSSLASLDLASNQLSGLIPNVFANMSSLAVLILFDNPLRQEIPTSIGQLCNLRDLYLGHCDLSGKLSDSVQRWSTCPQNSLQTLYLFDNNLSGSFPNLTNFTSLEDLHLSGNKLSGMIPDSIGKLSSLERLYIGENQFRWMIPESIGELFRLYDINLSGNLLSGRIPESIGQLSSLSSLDLSRNQLRGKIPESIGKLSFLGDLNLRENLLSGIPEQLWQMSSLNTLDLSSNRLRGRIPQSIGQLSSLVNINLSINRFEGEISETHFSNLSFLSSLDLSYNSLELNVTSDWIPPFLQLTYLSLRNCTVGPFFPKWLRTLKSLSYLDMSYGDISDVFPSWLWGLFDRNSTIDMSHNQIRGTLETSEAMSFRGVEVRLSSNLLEGLIPTFLSNVKYLDLSNNRFTNMTSFLCAPGGVQISLFLNLSVNHFSRELPDCWSHYVNLELLDLSNNAFSGNIPPSIGCLRRIKTLKLRSNNFVGEVPSSLKNCTSLTVIDLGNNKLSRSVPEWLGISLPKLVILMLQSNQFTGNLPSQLCHLAHLQILDFSMNELSGTMPRCLNNLTSMAQEGNSSPSIRHPYNTSGAEPPTISPYYDDDATFMWKGTLASYKSTLGLVKRIDLSSNRLIGEIPSEITHLVGLVSLNLSRNHLTGNIPVEIGKLESLDSLDLSRNKIHGRIPTSLAHIDRLGVMDLSYNNLSGEIPTGTQLQRFDPSSYIGNFQLCGPPLDVCNPKRTGPANGSSDQEDADELITQGFYISLGLGFAVGFWGVCGCLIFKRSWRYAYYNFLNSLNDWLYVRVALIRRKLKKLLIRRS